jgi:hypothetical protein
MSSVIASDAQCPVCKSDLQAGEARCANCLRPMVHVNWPGGDAVPVSAVMLGGLACVGMTIACLCWLLASKQLGLGMKLPVLSLVACFIPLAALLGWDGWLSVRSGVDRTRVFLSTGTEARITGAVKLALAAATIGFAGWALAVLPTFNIV